MNTFVSLTNVSGQLQLEQTTFETPPTCSVAPTLDTDLVNKAYADSKSGSSTISKISLSEEAGLNTTTGNLNITLAKNTFNYCLNNTTTSNYYSWSALRDGILNASCSVVAISGSDVYVGGSFSFISDGNITVNNIAKYDTITNTFSALGNGFNSVCRTLAFDATNNVLYAGGDFSTAGDITVNRIAKWDGTTWSELGTGFNGGCSAIAFDATNNVLYAGGTFNTAGGVTVNRIAKWNGTTWSALGTGFNNGSCSAIAVSGSDVYAGGSFLSATNASGSVTVNRIAKWNGTTWSALGSGLIDTCLALAVSGSDIYAGGSFTTTNDVTVTVNRIAKWNGTTWSALGTGFNSVCRTLVFDATNNVLYAGGDFTTTNDITVILNRIAKWNGTTWSALDNGFNNSCLALAVSGSNIYAGGSFTNYVRFYLKTVNLSVNNKFMYSMIQNDVINVDVANSTVPYTNGLVIR